MPTETRADCKGKREINFILELKCDCHWAVSLLEKHVRVYTGKITSYAIQRDIKVQNRSIELF